MTPAETFKPVLEAALKNVRPHLFIFVSAVLALFVSGNEKQPSRLLPS